MRLLAVSNRLPITAVEKEGKLEFVESAGGLVSGISAYLDSLKSSSFVKTEHIWVGWPGITVSGDKVKESVKSKLLNKFNSYPVFISKKDMEKFYYGFCNKTISQMHTYSSGGRKLLYSQC